jgi:hypothetical protein
MKNNLLFLYLILGLLIISGDSLYSQASFEAGTIAVNITNGGRMRVFTPNLAGAREIERLSVLVGVNEDAVFDYPNDADSEIPAASVTSPLHSDFELTSTLNNQYPAAPVPPDVLVRTNVYGWLNESYIVVRYRVINMEASAIDAIIGFETLHRTDNTYENDTIAYDPATQILYSKESKWVGTKLIATTPTSARIVEWYSGYSNADSIYYSWLTYNNFDTTPLITDGDGDIAVLSTAPVSIAPGDSAEIYFTIAIGQDKAEMEANVAEAEQKYNTIIPVELISFTAVAGNDKITLNWETATEVNNRGFEIERKINSGWATVGFKEGYGTSTDKHSYSFVDNISGVSSQTIYYRLKQVDFNGTFSYSDEVEVETLPDKFSLNQNYPNPFNPTTTISFSIPQKEFVTLKVYNLLGQEVAVLVNKQLEAGSHNFQYDADMLSSGIYLYELSAGNFNETRKMIVMK